MTTSSDELQELLKQDILQSVSIADELGRRAAEIERLRQQVAQRGARMQLLRGWMLAGTGRVWELFCHENPEAVSWFNSDGVPK